jgi:hypothetical protein
MASGVIDIFDYIPTAPAFITAALPDASGGTYMELWSGSGIPLTGFASGCAVIGDTGFYTWSTASITALPSVQEQYHWRMTSVSGVNTEQGDFILRSIEGKGGMMPPTNDLSDVLVDQS